MPDFRTLDKALATLQASDSVKEILRDLHVQALTEIPYVSTDDQPAGVALQRFVALEPDKLLLRASRATHVVEAGTSFGVSTIWLALAVSQNAAFSGGHGKVIATENETVKADRARRHWAQLGDAVLPWIDLRLEDIRESLKTNLPEQIDFVLLDIWSYLALPTLKLVQPKLRVGATIVVDNAIAAAEGYKDFHAYIEDPKNGFKNTMVPYTGGLQVIVYVGKQGQ
ncbi:hypothetical protein SLS60_007775 [Paraconiothyrium brasiliense]|uniref:O-methyltransferase n=1 Tax=Paraconiothyrium brasiliense TaxID=300254 RepID=A0ABR3R2J7_9PLEO